MGENFKEFEPHGWLRNGHLQTMAGAFLRRRFALPEGAERLFRVDAETQLKGVCHWQEGKRGDVPVIVIVHGLEGSCTITITGTSPRFPSCQWHTPFNCVSASTRNNLSSPSGNANFRRRNAPAIVCKCPFRSHPCGSNSLKFSPILRL